MKKYIVNRLDTNMPYITRAATPAMAMVLTMDKYFSSFWGPQLVEGIWEIYSQDGMIIKFNVQEVR